MSRAVGGTTLAALLLALFSRAACAASQPNILLILIDDLGAESSSLYPLAGESGAAAMPNIEKLAAQGLVFENAWVNPMCSPTRATIISGLYGHHTGVLVAGDVLDPKTRTIWDYIGKESPAKYDMAVFGKWHLGGNGGEIQHVRSMRVPNFRGFLGAQISDYYNWTAWDGNTGTAAPMATYATTALTNWAIDFIRWHEAERPQDPWFVYVPYNAVHAPFQVPPAGSFSIDVGGQSPGTRSATVPVFKAMIQALDAEIGRLLAHVDLKDTLVIYLGDNGTQANVKDRGAKVRGSKMSTWEGGAKVPLTIAGAGVTRTGREAALVNGVDLYATIAAAAGIKVKKANDGYSLLPLLSRAGAKTGRDFALTEFCNATASRFAIRDLDYKLVFDNATGWGLYHLRDDQMEAQNLYGTPAAKQVQARLQSALDKVKRNATSGCFDKTTVAVNPAPAP
jgi:arylsulfatase B